MIKKVSKNERTVNFTTSNCPPDSVFSDMTQSDPSTRPIRKRVELHLLQLIPIKQIKTDTGAKVKVLHTKPVGQYVINVQFDDVPHQVASFILKPTYCVKITVGVWLNALLTLLSLLDRAPAPI